MSDNTRICVVTDGGIDLSAELINRYGVLVVPRRVQVGRETQESNRHKTLSAISGKGTGSPCLAPPRLSDFLETYQAVNPSGTGLVSIHAPSFMDEAYGQACVGRKMLLPRPQVRVFEALALNSGVRFMVEAAARFVDEHPTTLGQAWAFLERLQHEMTSFLVTGGTGSLPCDPPLTLWDRIGALLLGRKRILWLDCDRRVFRRYDWPNDGPELSSDRTRDALITDYHSSPKAVQEILSWLRYRSSIRDIQPVHQLIQIPALPRNFVAVTLVPTPSELTAIAKWVRRWGGT